MYRGSFVVRGSGYPDFEILSHINCLRGPQNAAAADLHKGMLARVLRRRVSPQLRTVPHWRPAGCHTVRRGEGGGTRNPHPNPEPNIGSHFSWKRAFVHLRVFFGSYWYCSTHSTAIYKLYKLYKLFLNFMKMAEFFRTYITNFLPSHRPKTARACDRPVCGLSEGLLRPSV